MSLEVVTVTHSKGAAAEAAGRLAELVHRVATSETFEKSPKLRAFFLHVCRCALEDRSEEATEAQIGIYVYGRMPGYNSTEDNIVRSQARMLRMKLEHHFANEGKHEAVVITIPKGHYLPVFETRFAEARVIPELPERPAPAEPGPRSRWTLIGVALLFTLAAVWLGHQLSEIRPTTGTPPAVAIASVSQPGQTEPAVQLQRNPIALGDDRGEIRIAAGHNGNPYVDAAGHRWDVDRYYRGGATQPGPRHFYPPVAESGLFTSIREAVSDDKMVPQSEHNFSYDIPLSPGVYELRLYFADPLQQPDIDKKEDSQNLRHFDVDLNGRPLLVDFDPNADSGNSAVDVRVFKDVRPAADGKLHLAFRTQWGRAFVSALELTPGIPGKLKPIRIAASRSSDFVDADGTRWSADDNFIHGRSYLYKNPLWGPKIPPLYAGERHGNFSYAIPVAPGSYTLKLHFLESFFSGLIPAATCQGVGCRVFDVTCNGVMLLQNFDVVQAASGAFRPVVREFHGLHPNGQGKLLLSFSPTVNYAEVRAIEVIEESK